jgi:hypothetical protein
MTMSLLEECLPCCKRLAGVFLITAAAVVLLRGSVRLAKHGLLVAVAVCSNSSRADFLLATTMLFIN